MPPISNSLLLSPINEELIIIDLLNYDTMSLSKIGITPQNIPQTSAPNHKNEINSGSMFETLW